MRTSPTGQRPRKLKLAARRNVSTTNPAGFFQHSMNFTITAPGCSFVTQFPTLECDSFVTLGVDCVDLDDNTTIDPDFSAFKFNSTGEVSGGWFNSAPSNGQGVPDANDRVLIGRFSYKQNKNTSGDVCVFVQLAGSNDITEFLLQPFDCAVPGMQADPPPPGGPTICFVDDDGTQGNSCLNSWANACPELQTALDPALACDQIWVAEGTYKPDFDIGQGVHTGDRNATFQLKNGVAVYGGFDGTEMPGVFDLDNRDFVLNETILSGDIGTTDDNSDNSYHVVTGSFVGSDAILDGFTITAGHANGQGEPAFCFLGGGLPCNPDGQDPCDPCVSEKSIGGGMIVKGDGSSPIVTNCTFRENTVLWAGGGMYIGFSNPTITDCTFIANHAGDGAGAMCNNFGSNSTVSNCCFIGNTAFTAGGMGNLDGSSPTVTDCFFLGNSATNEGGAFYNNTGSNPIVTHCTFSENTASAKGGAILNTESNPTLINCIFSGNKVTASNGAGGAIHNTNNSNGTAISSIFTGNSANSGAAMSFVGGSSPTLSNCTFAGNSAAANGGGLRVSGSGSNPTVDNCVFWENNDGGGTDESAQISINEGDATLTFTDIMGLDLAESGPFCVDPNGDPPCEGNINADPKFLGGPSGNWSAVAVFNSATGQTTFTDDPGAWMGDLTDMFLNPDTAQPLQSLIVSNTDMQIVVWGDFADLAQNNEIYQINDYRLDSPNSPCIDAADNNAVTFCGADLDGNDRFFDDPAVFPNRGLGSPEHPDDITDMGAYEFGSPPPPDCNGNGSPDECDIESGASLDCQDTGVPDECCPADLSGDEEVESFDLALLLGSWGACTDCEVGNPACTCQADLDNSCEVEPFDLALLLGNWGPCP